MKRALLLFVVLVTASGAALAHGRGRVQFGLHFGVPLFPYHYYPPPAYYYPYPAYSYPPVALSPAAPPVYVERDQPVQAQDWWYYCEQTRGYYPYVKECPMGWKRVPPAPPPAQ